jgi:DNA-binding cell septation regulator SpoVG
MKIYLQAALTDGTTVTGEFDRLAHVQRYVSRVYAGVAPFNVWQTVSTTHPVSGETNSQRVRVMVNGDRINCIRQVNVDGSPFVETARGEAGLWVAPAENTPEGAVAGVRYPVSREAETLARYVVLKVATDGQPEKRHYLDPATQGPADGDEDRDAEAGLVSTEEDEETV